jgi:hypothetical protein
MSMCCLVHHLSCLSMMPADKLTLYRAVSLLLLCADAGRMTEQVPVLACDKPLDLHATALML